MVIQWDLFSWGQIIYWGDVSSKNGGLMVISWDLGGIYAVLMAFWWDWMDYKVGFDHQVDLIGHVIEANCSGLKEHLLKTIVLM